MADSLNEPRHQDIPLMDVREVLKEHFPEYISQHCLCGHPVATYMAWIDHVMALLESSASGEEDESNDRSL